MALDGNENRRQQKKGTRSTGFEPVRAEPSRYLGSHIHRVTRSHSVDEICFAFQVCRLDHSANCAATSINVLFFPMLAR